MVLSIEQRELRRTSLARGFSNSIEAHETCHKPTEISTTPEITPTREELMIALFSKLRNILQKEMTQWWDILLLENYIKTNRVPRGLRLTKTCIWLDDDLKDAWAIQMRELNKKLLSSIITQRERNLLKIRNDLKNVQDDLAPFTDLTSFNDWDKKINDHMVTFETNLISKKSGKFERDRLDYLYGREFEWKRPTDGAGPLTNKSKSLPRNDICPMGPPRHKKPNTNKGNTTRQRSHRNSQPQKHPTNNIQGKRKEGHLPTQRYHQATAAYYPSSHNNKNKWANKLENGRTPPSGAKAQQTQGHTYDSVTTSTKSMNHTLLPDTTTTNHHTSYQMNNTPIQQIPMENTQPCIFLEEGAVGNWNPTAQQQQKTPLEFQQRSVRKREDGEEEVDEEERAPKKGKR